MSQLLKDKAYNPIVDEWTSESVESGEGKKNEDDIKILGAYPQGTPQARLE